MTKEAYDPEAEGAKMTFADAMSYGDYLSLDSILNSQVTLSSAHDELLFIVQHQTSELWMKLILHELGSARTALKTGDTANMFKMLARVSRIFEQLNNQWDVLRTMTPADYTAFREDLGPSSGFQSYQYRMIEYVLEVYFRKSIILKQELFRFSISVRLFIVFLFFLIQIISLNILFL